MKNVREHFLRVHKVFCQLFANDKISFLGSNRSIETKNSKKSCFHGDKVFWPVFPGILECDKPQGTIYKGPQAALTFTVEVTRSFLWDLRGC